jgi:hypothetical protein
LEPFLALRHRELDALPFLQGTMPVTSYCAEVYKHVITLLSLDEAVALGIVKPLYRTDFTFGHKLDASAALKKPLLLVEDKALETKPAAGLGCPPSIPRAHPLRPYQPPPSSLLPRTEPGDK